MNEKTITICGAPNVGKLALLEEIARIKGAEVICYKHKQEYVRKLRVVAKNNKMEMLTTTSSIFYQEETFSHILENTDLIIYVFPAQIEHIEIQETHEIYFETYNRIAQKLNKTVNYIPWIILTRIFFNPLIKKQMLPFIISLQNTSGLQFIDYKENIVYKNPSVSFMERWLGKTDFRSEFEGINFLLNQITAKLFVDL
jgi:hypothetical protein